MVNFTTLLSSERLACVQIDQHQSASSPDTDDENYKKHLAKRRREYLAHKGPRHLAKALANGTLERRHDAVYKDYPESLLQPFAKLDEYPNDQEGLIHPADKYQKQDILAQLSTMPESEQPSRGWKWFCDKYDIDSLGIGPTIWSQWWNICERSHGYELRWGFPFWDREKLELWGLIPS